MEKQKKINKKMKRMAKRLEGVLMIRHRALTISLNEDEIYKLLTEGRIEVKEGDIQCTIE